MQTPDPGTPSPPSNLTRNQLLIWLGQEMHPQAPIYNVIMTFRLEDPVDPAAFQSAFDCLVREAEPLRTVFAVENGQPRRIVLPDPPAPCEVIDPGGGPAGLQDWINRNMAHRIDLRRSVYRSVLLRSGPLQNTWFLAIHHICTDSTSNSILVARMAELYALSVAGAGAADGCLPSFERFLEYERREEHRSPPASGQEGEPMPTRFYRGRAAPEGTPSARHVHDLDPELSRLLRQQAEVPGTGLTPELGMFNLLVTTVAALLYRLERRRRISLGVVTRNRPTEEFKRTPGLFMEIVPVHIDLTPGETFETLLEKVFSQTSAALIRPPGSSSANERKQCDVVVNYLTNTFGNFGDIGMETRWLHTGYMDPHYRLCVHFEDYNQTGNYRLLADCATDAFTGEDARRALRHLERTLRCLLAERSQPLAHYALLEPDEIQCLLSAGGVSATAPAPSANLSRMIYESGKVSPETAALVDRNHALSYRDLLHRADRWASALHRQGVSAGDVVAIQDGRTAEFVVAVVATLRLGAVFLPLDPSLPADRAAHMLEDARAAILVSSRPVAIPTNRGPLPSMSWSDLDRAPGPAPLEPAPDPGRAYIMFTSGTTGRPKGVACRHASVTNLLEELERRAPLPRQSRTSWWTSVGFDVMIYELFSALCFGRTLCIPSEPVRLDPERLVAWIDEENIAGAYLPGSALAALERAAESGACRCLKRLLVGVEPIPQRLLSAIARNIPGLTVINGYGPTEATVCASLYTVDPADTREGPAPIGTPVPGGSLFILDDEGNLLPRGAPGELCIAGAGLADGYVSQPEWTAARFPLAARLPGGERRIYRTGDLARWRQDGQLEFLGRIDSQMKVRGYRIEPDEIIGAALEIDTVHRAAVRPWDDQIALYLSSISVIDDDAIRRHLASRLPFFMLPAYIVPLAGFPETPSGKVDVESLPDPRSVVTPGTGTEGPVESTLAGLFQEILGLPEVGATDHFLQLGGDSLRAMRLLAMVAARFGVDLDLPRFFQLPTVRGLAKLVEQEVLREIEAMSEEDAQRELLG